MDDMGSQSMMGYTSYSGFLTGLLVLLIKFLILILIISVILGVFVWVKNNFFKNISFTQLMNQNPMVKSGVGIIVLIIGLFLLLSLFGYLTGGGYNYSMGNMSGYYNYGFGLSGIIIFLFKALTFFFTITLVISLIAYVMKQSGIWHSGFFQNINKNFQGSNTQNQYNKNYSDVNQPKPADEQDNDNI